MWVSEVKSTANALRHFEIDPVLKIYANVHGGWDLCDLA